MLSCDTLTAKQPTYSSNFIFSFFFWTDIGVSFTELCFVEIIFNFSIRSLCTFLSGKIKKKKQFESYPLKKCKNEEKKEQCKRACNRRCWVFCYLRFHLFENFKVVLQQSQSMHWILIFFFIFSLLCIFLDTENWIDNIFSVHWIHSMQWTSNNVCSFIFYWILYVFLSISLFFTFFYRFGFYWFSPQTKLHSIFEMNYTLIT